MIRAPAVAGMFYPAGRDSLMSMVRSFLKDSGRTPDSGISGIVSPHAGYVYSGAVAGAAFASAPPDVGSVVIIAPPHRYPVRGASVYGGEGYKTPLGTAPVSSRITSRLLDAGLGFQPEAHASEHSAEVQVPFVQVRWPDAEIAVILQGTTSSDFSSRLAGAVSNAIEGDERALVVASSDLSHYHPLHEAGRKDRKVIEAFLTGDPARLDEAVTGGGEACGAGPMLTLMHFARLRGHIRFEEIMWRTSADASGDTSSVVGYFAGCCGSAPKT